jgi:ParB family chromosome partitioning protein
MVDSNLQRETILPSEKAFAYKMKLEAMKRQGERTDLTSSPLDKKLKGLTSAQQVSQKSGDSQPQIYRYIRLTELIPSILDMVDNGKIAFRPAVELSYLSKEQQQSLYDTMECEDCTPSLAQAIKMKEFSRDGKLTEEVILSIMQEEKPNQREKPAFRDERITRLIPKSIPRGQETDFVIRALEFYNRHLQRRRDQER